MRALLQVVLNALGLWLTAQIVPGVGSVLALFNWLVRAFETA